MKEDISIVKLNISNLQKTVIPPIKHTETLKIAHPYITYNNFNY